LRHQTMDKVQKHNSFNTNTPSSESYINYLYLYSQYTLMAWCSVKSTGTTLPLPYL